MDNINNNALAIGARIRMSLSRLSLTERRIAEWLVTKGNVDKKTSIKAVATALNVSEPLIVKVAKKLGYSGFKELRLALLSYFLSLPFEKDLEVSEDDNMDSVLDKIFSNSIYALKEAQSVADTRTITQAAKLTLQAKHVAIWGVGGSASVCQDFEHKLLRIGIHSHSYNDSHLMLMVACQLEKDDVVIVISQSGDTKELLKAVQVAKESEAKIICITNDNASPLAQSSDLSIFSPARGGPLLGQNAVARIIQLNLLDTLFIAIILEDYHGTKKKLEKSIEVVKPLHGKG